MEHRWCACTATAQVLSFTTAADYSLCLSLFCNIHNDLVELWQPMLVRSLSLLCLNTHPSTEKDPVVHLEVVCLYCVSDGALCCVCSDLRSPLHSLRLNSRAHT